MDDEQRIDAAAGDPSADAPLPEPAESDAVGTASAASPPSPASAPSAPSYVTDDATDMDATAALPAVAASEPRAHTRRRRRKALLAGRMTFVLAVGAILVIAAAGVTWVLSPGWGGGSGGGTTYTTRNIGVVPTDAPPGVPDLSLSPNRIEIPKLRAVAPIVTVATDANRELGVPLDPKIVGWWNGGARPGAKKGTAILDGHINYAGVKGVLADIGTLNPGDIVYVYGVHNGHATRLAFSITGVRTYSKTALPYAEIFDQKSVGRLAIVTCGGPFDASTGNYRDNIVAFAVADTSAT